MRTRAVFDGVYNRLKEMILSNHLKPGQKLLDRGLANELGVSRTPGQEALSRLQQDGLVDNRAGKGYFVADMDAKQIADLYDLREMLEALAVRLAAERATLSDLAQLEGVLATLEEYRDNPAKRGEEIKVGLRIHETIARASGNAFLHETLVRLLDRMQFFIWMEMLYEDRQAADLTRTEHKALLVLIREKRADEAEALIRTHVRTAKQHILKIVRAREDFYQQTSPVPAMATRP